MERPDLEALCRLRPDDAQSFRNLVREGLPTILELPRASSNRNPEFARLAQNEAAGCTMRTARELKMEIPARDPTLPDFRNGLPPDVDFDRRPSVFRQILRRKHVPTHFANGSDRGPAVRRYQ